MSLFILQFFLSSLLLQHQLIYPNPSMKYLALGDSYTIGESVEFMDRFPVQLVNKLKFEGINFNMPKIIAKTGWTTGELIEEIAKEQPTNKYDLVTLLIGVNNQYRGLDISTYKQEFDFLLQKSIEFAGGDNQKVIVVSIPDYGVTPFGQKKGRKKIGEAIDHYNDVNLEITNSYGVTYIDVTKISRTAYRKMSLIAQDGLHPSGEMYGQWVEEILPAVFRILEAK